MRIILNARIHTLDSNLPVASAIVIDKDRIRDIGDQERITANYGHLGDQFDLEGRTIIPGLTDAHIHLEQYALAQQKVDCETTTINECLDKVAAKVQFTPAGEWILGHGWNQNDWPEGFGHAKDLDTIAPQNPVYLTAKSLHAAWVNSSAMRLANISQGTADPEGGHMQREDDGTPTGILFETAMSLVAGIIPEPSPNQVALAIKDAQTKLWELGITGVHDFDRRRCFAALQRLHQGGELKLRVIKSIPLESLNHAIALGLRTGFGDDFLRIGSIKAFSDGALGPRTAAMLQPYESEADNRGILMLDSETLFEQGRSAVENGLSLAVHAIGDHANHEVLKAYSQLREHEQQSSVNSTRRERPLRHRLEHVQILHPDDIPSLASLDVIASMQPIHATSDYEAADRYWGNRARYAYAWRTLLDQGTLLAFGSDAPVESPNPFWGLHAAVTRRRADGSPGSNGWYPEQKLTLSAALQGFTSGAAYAAGMEDRLGKLSPGYLADLIILDKNIFKCEPDDIRSIRPLGTMIAGSWVYIKPELGDLISSDEHPPL